MKKKINNLSAAVLFALLYGLLPSNAFSQVTELYSIIYDRFSPTSDPNVSPKYVKMDALNNVYVIGAQYDSILVIKYNSAGAKQWQRAYKSFGGPKSVELDNDGNIFLFFNTFGYANDPYYFTLKKINSSGTTLWSVDCINVYIGDAQLVKENYMAIGSSGIYVLARTVGSLKDYITLKFSHSGAFIWQRFYDSGTPAQPLWDFPSGLTIDDNENVYVTGSGRDTTTSYLTWRNFTTLKYNSSGTLIWSAKITRGSGKIHSIAADNSGNVYLAGHVADSYSIIKYNSSGVYEWAKYLKGSNEATYYNNAKKIIIDPAGNPTVSGTLHDSTGVLTTIKYTPGGSQIWMSKYEEYRSSFCDFTLINSTDILIAGKVTGHGLSDDIVLLKYDNNGILKWKEFYASPYGDLEPEDLESRYDLFSGKTFFYVTSRVAPLPDYDSDMLTAKFEEYYAPRPSATNTPGKYELQQNYPNPFNPQTKISFSILRAGNVKLAVYDAVGKEVSVLTNSQMEAGTYEIDLDASQYASGVYFYKLQSGDFTDIKKMLLVK